MHSSWTPDLGSLPVSAYPHSCRRSSSPVGQHQQWCLPKLTLPVPTCHPAPTGRSPETAPAPPGTNQGVPQMHPQAAVRPPPRSPSDLNPLRHMSPVHLAPSQHHQAHSLHRGPPCTTATLQDWERGPFKLIHRIKHRKSKWNRGICSK